MPHAPSPPQTPTHPTTLGEVMSRHLQTVAPDATLTEAAQTMARHHVSCVVVQGPQGPVGIVTESDLVRTLNAGTAASAPVTQAMSAPLVGRQESDDFEAAWSHMLAKGLRHLVVLNPAQQVVGLITETDVSQRMSGTLLQELGGLSDLMAQELPELPPEASVAQALALMVQTRHAYVLVTRNQQALGLLTERDMPRLLLTHGDEALDHLPLAGVMTRPVHTVNQRTWLPEVVNRMRELRVRHMVVVNDEAHVVGLVEQHDLVTQLAKRQAQQRHMQLHSDLLTRSQRAEALHNLAADAAQLGFWDFDGLSHTIAYSEHMMKIMGGQGPVPVHLDIGHFLGRVHPDQVAEVRKVVQNGLAVNGDGLMDAQYQVTGLDGQWRWVHTRGRVVQRDAQGHALRAVGVTMDIEQRKQQENSLAQALAELQARQRTLEHLSQTINRSPVVAISWSTTPGWPVTFVSDNVSQWGYDRATFMRGDLRYEDLVHPDDLPRINAEIAAFYDQALDSYDQRYRLRAADGRWLWIDDHTWIDRAPDGQLQSVHGMLTDVTERHALQQIARIERDLLENLARGLPLKTLLTQLTDAYSTVFDGARCSVALAGEPPQAGSQASLPPPCCARPILNSQGKRLGTFAVHSDKARKPQKHELNALERGAYLAGLALERAANEATLRKLWLAVEQSPNSIVITDLQARIEYANQSFYAVTGYTPDEVIGANPKMLQSGKTDPEVYADMWAHLTQGQPWIGEFTNRRKDGSEYVESVRISPVHQTDGSVTHYLAIKEDVTHRKESEQQIHRLAYFDTLTGLPNRLLLADRFKQAVSMAERQQEPLSVMFIDLDHFKNINDTLGHRAGDALLIEAAQRLSSVLRAGDTLSRQGGDEFVLLLPGCGNVQAAQVAEKLLDTSARSMLLDGHDVVVTLSVGIAVYPSDGSDFDALSKAADVAMYRAKEEGRNTYRFFKADMQTHSARTLLLESHLRHALDRGELALQYQPQMSLADGCLVGAEALLRWHHPTLGLVSPVEFIPLAESSGMILPIGEWVLRTAAQQLKDWTAQGLGNLTMAVNLSAVQFRHAGLANMVAHVLQATDIPPGKLELELTESVAMDDPLGAVVAMDEIGALGVAMSIDDFGTGYSSLSYLKRFKVGKLKIDKSFVRDITTDPDDKAIASAIIGLASSLGLRTIAEGVETPGQLAWLRLQGCDEAQGYFFSQPLSAPGFAQWVRDSGLLP